MSSMRRLCAGGIQPVKIVHGDGQILSLLPPVKVEDILKGYAHHYICHMSPDPPPNRSAMLPWEDELEPGCVYFLLPLPRLFPTSASGTASCCCLSNHDRSSTPTLLQQKGGFQQMMERFGSPLRSAKKVSPELTRSPSPANSNLCSGKDGGQDSLLSPSYGSSKPKGNASPKRSPNRLRENAKARIGGNGCLNDSLCSKWKPGLGCISETDSFVAACKELQLCLDRRILTFDCKVRPNSPLRLSDVCNSPSRDSRSRRESFNMATPNMHMAAGYVFV